MAERLGNKMSDEPEFFDDDAANDFYLNFWYEPISDLVVIQLLQADTDEYNEMECDMCGKQNNPKLREGGSWMCSTCWQVWNG